jgi:uncharacterized protein (TIGR04255 family)
MRIQKADRLVSYRNNPLVEVICQARFRRSEASGPPPGFLKDLASAGYEVVTEVGLVNVNFNVMGAEPGGTEVHESISPPMAVGLQTYNCMTSDGNWTVAFSAESVSLSCKVYSNWTEFRSRFIKAVELYGAWYPKAKAVRLGLRYKDLVDREKLGLADLEWHELIQPFLLGALASGVFADDAAIPDAGVAGCLTHALVKLADCSLTLQSAFLRSVTDSAKTVFLIDSDFFKDSGDILELAYASDVLDASLKVLHEHAGDMFRRVIKEELHAALEPIG